MAKQLTAKERKTLNEAEQILKDRFVVPGESLLFSFHAGWEGVSTTYFTPKKVQHGQVWDPEDRTLAGKIAVCIGIRMDEEGRAEQIKAERIERLRKELSDLTEQVPA